MSGKAVSDSKSNGFQSIVYRVARFKIVFSFVLNYCFLSNKNYFHPTLSVSSEFDGGFVIRVDMCSACPRVQFQQSGSQNLKKIYPSGAVKTTEMIGKNNS